MSAPEVGFIGLGIMGRPMALNLVRAGHRLVVHSRSRPPVDELAAAGAVAAAGAREVGFACEVVLTMLPDTHTVEEVVRTVAAVLRPGGLVVDHSTIHPDAARTLAAELAERGLGFIDAPVSGGERGAIEGSLSIMAGGDPAHLGRVDSLFRAMGSRVVHAGGPGAGQVTKAVNQLVVMATIEVVAEALVLAAKAGVSPSKVREALLGGFAQSRILDSHGERMLRRDFRPGGRTELHRKDIEVIGALARSSGITLPAFEAAAAQVEALIAHGGGGLDHSALVTELERSAGVELSASW